MTHLTQTHFCFLLVAALHGVDSVEELGEILLAGHLVGGHNTGFGKLFDEKLLRRIFDIRKLDKRFREFTPPYSQSAFNDIDHVVPRDGYDDLVSLKSSRWTINLGGARDLNRSFEQIRQHHMRPYPGRYGEIAVGVLYGRELTDKYREVLGETERQRRLHDVTDLTDTVQVYSGREFWSWLNDGQSDIQYWIMDGLLLAVEEFKGTSAQKALMFDLVRNSENLRVLGADGNNFEWHKMLKHVNG